MTTEPRRSAQPSIWDYQAEPMVAAEPLVAAEPVVAAEPLVAAEPQTAPQPRVAERPAGPGYVPRILRVTELNRRVRILLDQDTALTDVWVEGEISSPSLPPSGHCFFTLKDSGSQIKAVMFREELHRSVIRPVHGMQAICHGRVAAYEAQGIYQLYVESIQPAGRGDLHARYEALRARLTAEGLFTAERKRPLPRWPRRIGVVTSPVGAVWRDIGNVLRRRYPVAEVVLSPTSVQGPTAAGEIVRALRRLYAVRDLDVIILARGGGSLEDLWPFNEEEVVRSIAASPLPVVVGVGHESDTTLADFVADVRAPTPSAAAELAVPDGTQLPAILSRLRDRATLAANAAVAERRRRLVAEARALAAHRTDIPALRQRAGELLDRAHRAAAGRVEHDTLRVAALGDRVRAVGPSATLARGYAVARATGGAIVRDPAAVARGEELEVVVHRGRIATRVEGTTPSEPEELLR